MLRSRIGIERMLNLITILYSAMKLLPYLENEFSEYQIESVQDFRWYSSKRIREQNYTTFRKNSRKRHKIKSNFTAITTKGT